MGPFRALVIALGVAATACSIRVSENNDEANRAQCGNGHLDPGEVCDDNNTEDGDGCSADCSSDESCGNGVVDTSVGESCDDGNALGGDGCSADCKSSEQCGNGVIDPAKGETCDDGNLIAGDGCSANCQSNEACGNSILDPGTTPPEQCDGGPTGSSTCNPNCTTSRCGDGVVNPKANEECDDANNNNGDQCDNQCRKVMCGDSRVTGNEQCDDGNSVSTDDCIACVAARCGDGFVRDGVEQCDDNNNDNGDGCDANCQYEPIIYSIDVTGLVNQDSFCDGTGVNRYDGCGGRWVVRADHRVPVAPTSSPRDAA